MWQVRWSSDEGTVMVVKITERGGVFAGARKTGRNDAVNALVKSGRTSTEHGGGALVLGIPSDGRSVAVNATVKSGRKSTEHGGGAM